MDVRDADLEARQLRDDLIKTLAHIEAHIDFPDEDIAPDTRGKLVEHGADVTIVAPDLIPAVKAFVDRGQAKWEPREFREGDTDGLGGDGVGL